VLDTVYIELGKLEQKITEILKTQHQCLNENRLFQLEVNQSNIKKSVEEIGDNYKKLSEKIDDRFTKMNEKVTQLVDTQAKYTRAIWISFWSIIFVIVSMSFGFFLNIHGKVIGIENKLVLIENKIGVK
jgi:septal ring factor EnvC (AmiA/AmiB activator)